MLLIGGRMQASRSPSAPVGPSTPVHVQDSDEVAPQGSVHNSVVPFPSPEPKRVVEDPVQAEIDRGIADYQRRLLEETAIGSYAGVEVHLRLTGEVVQVDISEHVPVRYDAATIGEIVVRASQAAAAYAAQRRTELLEQVQFFNEGAMKRVRQMRDDPEGAVEEMSAVRYW